MPYVYQITFIKKLNTVITLTHCVPIPPSSEIITIMSTMLLIPMCTHVHTYMSINIMLFFASLIFIQMLIRHESFYNLICLFKLFFWYLYMLIYPTLVQESENYHAWSQINLLPVVINTVLLEHSHWNTLIRWHIVYGCFLTIAVELRQMMWLSTLQLFTIWFLTGKVYQLS